MRPPRSTDPVEQVLLKFLTNDWVHLERKVASLEGKVHVIIGMLAVLIGLTVYAVTK